MEHSGVRDGMRIEWDVPIEMDDGAVLRADVFRPVEDGEYPVIMTHGPYAKGVSFQEGYAGMWNTLVAKHPEVLAGSSNKYQNWETVDPERWVPGGYACVRVDSRGAGTSPGFLDICSPRETRDYYECVEWAGTRPWSNGRVGMDWLRASHRALDPERSLPYRPWHPHDAAQPLEPGETVRLDIEIWPTSVIVPPGYRIGVTITGRDFELPGAGPWPGVYGVTMRGHGMFLHDDPRNRPADVFGGTTTLTSGGERSSFLLLPFVPRA